MSDDAWLTERPPERIERGEVVLARASVDDREVLVAAVNASLDHLRPWMPWAQVPATPESIGTFLAGAVADWEAGREFQYVINQDGAGRILGCCGLHARLGPGVLEIGYWVHVDHVRRGVATTVAQMLSETALSLSAVQRVEIRCDADNVASAAIPRRLGYRLGRIDVRPPATPGETHAHMIWIHDR